MSETVTEQDYEDKTITGFEKELVRARIRRWRNVRSGWLVIKPGQVVVYRSKFIGKPEKVENFKTSLLTGIEPNESNNGVRLVFDNPEGEPIEEVFSFLEGKQAETVTTIVAGLLKEAQEEKKRKEEEAAKLEKERQERLKQIREAFAGEVWGTLGVLWLMARANYSMVRAVIMADWNEAGRQYSMVWKQADKLNKTSQIELTAALKELDEAVSSRDGKEVIRKAGPLIRELSAQVLQTEAMWARWQDQIEMLVRVSPNYNHLPYFLLFAAGYFEALLSAQIEDWAGANNVLSLLRSSSTVLRQCFDIDFDGLLDEANSAAIERDADLFAENTHRVESVISASCKEGSFNFEMQEQELKG